MNKCLTLTSSSSQYPNEPIGSPQESLGSVFAAELGAGSPFNYTEPLMSGGISTTGAVYAGVLRGVLSGSLAFGDALGTNPVCTQPSTSYYGIISHYQASSAYSTIECGRLIRAAFMTGVEQTGTLPIN